MNPPASIVGPEKAVLPPSMESRVNADQFRQRAAVWRQRAVCQPEGPARDADLRLAGEYERLADSVSAADAAAVTDDRPPDPPGDSSIKT